MAKILARSEGSHEIVGGAGGGMVSDTAVAPVLAVTSKPDAGTMPGDSGDIGPSVEEEALVGGGGERDTGVNIVGERASGGKTPSAADGRSTRDSGLAGPGSNADHAPWEGSELSGAVTPNSDKVAGVGTMAKAALACGKKANSSVAPKKKKGAKGDKARSQPAAKRDTAAVRRIRRRLEQAAARAAAVTLPAESEQEDREEGEAAEKHKEWEEAAKEVWDVLRSLPSPGGGGELSLETIFGDGITAESLIGVARGLRYACGIDAARFSAEGAAQEGEANAQSNTERASEVCSDSSASIGNKGGQASSTVCCSL